MGNVEKEYKEVIKSLDNNFKNDPIINNYIEATDHFNKLVEKGIIKRRGHNLKTTEQGHLVSHNFNNKM